MKTYLPKIVFIALLFFGCQKEDLVDCTIETGPKLKRILSCYDYNCDPPHDILVEFEYDEKERISKVSSLGSIGGVDLFVPIKYGTYEFNSKGQLVKITRSDGGYDLYEYNSRGQLIKMENFIWYNPDSEILHFRTYYYTYFDDCKIEKEYIEYQERDMYIYNLYQYSYTGKLSREEHYENSEELDSYTIYKYNDSGNLIEELSYDIDCYDELCSYTVHTYENGLNVRTDVYAELDKSYHLLEIFKEYDANKNLINVHSHTILGATTSYILKYEYFEE